MTGRTRDVGVGRFNGRGGVVVSTARSDPRNAIFPPACETGWEGRHLALSNSENFLSLRSVPPRMSAAYRKRHVGSSKGNVAAQKRRNRERQAERRRAARAEAIEDADVTRRQVPAPGSPIVPDPGPDPLGQLMPNLRRAGSQA